jgi:pectinesterase
VIALAGCAVLAAYAGAAATPQASTTVTLTNPIATARPAETIELTVDSLKHALTFDDLRKIHVKDDKTGKDLLTQAVDLDDDGTFELVVFQADLGASERRTFSLSVGERHIAMRDEFRAYGRFVRERRDDFVWENDLVAHRMYGAALETWAQEPLTSSAVDVWVKKTPRLVVNDWYMVDDYHQDHGEGADLYSAGKTRGCGGNGIWQNGKLYPSANFRGTRVLANGPLRVMFELVYDPWDAGGQKLSETKRITLDAGQRLNRFESRYSVPAPRVLQQAIGIKKAAGADVSVRKEAGVMRTWEAFAGNNGNVGCGVIADPREVADAPELDGNVLLVTRVAAGTPAVYWAGSAWDRGGAIATAAAWDRYLDDWAARLRAPVVVTVGR